MICAERLFADSLRLKRLQNKLKLLEWLGLDLSELHKQSLFRKVKFQRPPVT